MSEYSFDHHLVHVTCGNDVCRDSHRNGKDELAGDELPEPKASDGRSDLDDHAASKHLQRR